MYRIPTVASLIALLVMATSHSAGAQRIREGTLSYRLETALVQPLLPPAATADTLAERGHREGEAAAKQTYPWGWFGRGFLGGVLGGPIGTVVAYRKADRQIVMPPTAEDLHPADRQNRLYLEGYTAGFSDRARARRKGYALIGGAIGTGVLTYALLQLFDMGGKAGGTVIVPPPAPPGI